jgi:hypothetical protein
MPPRGHGSSSNANPTLSSVGKREVIELLKLADTSTHPEIREVAARIAEQESEHLRNRETKVSPTLVLVLASSFIIAAAAASWLAIVRYPGAVGLEITGALVAFLVLAIGVYMLLSGHLTREDFMQMVGMIWERFKKTPSEPSEPVLARVEVKAKPLPPVDTGKTPTGE